MRIGTKGFIGILLGALLFSGLMASNWERLDAERNEFARGCNAMGKIAVFDAQARQCVAVTNQRGER